MAKLVKLFDEKVLLVNLQADTLILIRGCHTVQPMKKFLEAHDILSLTSRIQQQWPTEWPDTPVCDEDALLHLLLVLRELSLYHGNELPRPGFDLFDKNIRTLLKLFKVPKGENKDVRLEDGSAIPEELKLTLTSIDTSKEEL